MSYWFLPYNVSQPYVYISPPLESPSYPDPFPTLWVVPEHQVELPVLYRKFPLATYFAHATILVSVLFSRFVPTPHLSASLFSLSASTVVQSPSRVWLFATPWRTSRQASRSHFSAVVSELSALTRPSGWPCTARLIAKVRYTSPFQWQGIDPWRGVFIAALQIGVSVTFL